MLSHSNRTSEEAGALAGTSLHDTCSYSHNFASCQDSFLAFAKEVFQLAQIPCCAAFLHFATPSHETSSIAAAKIHRLHTPHHHDQTASISWLFNRSRGSFHHSHCSQSGAARLCQLHCAQTTSGTQVWDGGISGPPRLLLESRRLFTRLTNALPLATSRARPFRAETTSLRHPLRSWEPVVLPDPPRRRTALSDSHDVRVWRIYEFV